MEILYLIDRLEALISKARRIFFLPGVLINKEEFQEIVDQMRLTIPQEIRGARRTTEDKEKILDQAREEAQRTVFEAEKKAESLLSEQELLKSVADEREKILGEARRDAEEIRKGADEYAISVLGDLEDQLMAVQTTIRNGLDYLQGPRRRKKES